MFGRSKRVLALDIGSSEIKALEVTDSGNSRVQKFRSDGQFIAMLGEPEQFSLPTSVAVDYLDNVYVLDWDRGLQMFAPDGSLLAAWGGIGTEPGELSRPQGMAFDSKGMLFVGDGGNNRIQVYVSPAVTTQ